MQTTCRSMFGATVPGRAAPSGAVAKARHAAVRTAVVAPPAARLEDGRADDVLLARTARGDTRALELLFHRYRGRLRRYAATFRRDEHFMDDVLMETMTAVWRAAGSYDPAASASSWILAIARHKALDATRRLHAHRYAEAPAGADEPADDKPLPPARLASAQSAVAVRAALEQLSAAHREVLVLAYLEDLPYPEIARRVGIPTNTVKTRVFHAKRLLEHALAKAGLGRESLEF